MCANPLSPPCACITPLRIITLVTLVCVTNPHLQTPPSNPRRCTITPCSNSLPPRAAACMHACMHAHATWPLPVVQSTAHVISRA